MKTAGIIGEIGPESTIDSYRLIISSYRERVKEGRYPSIVINSIDLKRILDPIAAGELAEHSPHRVRRPAAAVAPAPSQPIARRIADEDGIEGLILGVTELPLLMRGAEVPGVPFLDTTRLHVEQVVKSLLT